MRVFASLVFALAIAGCGGNNSTTDGGGGADLSGAVHDMAAACNPSMPAASQCGHQCDKGNSKGIGAFCDNMNASCGAGLLCSHLVEPTTYFCTKACTPDKNNMDVATCGENTLCQCAGAGCGCTPNSCVQAPQG